jgi:DNA topoisomerase-3
LPISGCEAEILQHYKYCGEVLRVLFTAQDPQTICDAFGRAKPNAEYARLYAVPEESVRLRILHVQLSIDSTSCKGMGKNCLLTGANTRPCRPDGLP